MGGDVRLLRRRVPRRGVLSGGRVGARVVPQGHVPEHDGPEQQGGLPALPAGLLLRRDGERGARGAVPAGLLLHRQRGDAGAVPDAQRHVHGRRLLGAAVLQPGHVPARHGRGSLPPLSERHLLPGYGHDHAAVLPRGRVLRHGRGHVPAVRRGHVQPVFRPEQRDAVHAVHARRVLRPCRPDGAHRRVRRRLLLQPRQHAAQPGGQVVWHHLPARVILPGRLPRAAGVPRGHVQPE